MSEEKFVAKPNRDNDRIDPSWPSWSDGDHPVSELAAPIQGALSPYGEVTFPLPPDQIPYEHPHTEINR